MKYLNRYYLPLILVVGAALRVLNLTNSPLWYDEAFSVLIARLDTVPLLKATMGDVHPPIYYLVISGIFSLFPNVDQFLLLRGFSVVCSLDAIYQVWLLSGELRLSERSRKIAVLLMAVSPVEIFYAQEGRMYALLQVLVLNQFRAMLYGNWRVLGMYSFLSIFTHNYGLFYSAVIYAVGLARSVRNNESLWAPLLSGSAALASYLPWLLFVTSHQMDMVSKGYWIQPLTVGNVIYSFFRIVFTTIIPGELLFIAAPVLALLLLFSVKSGLEEKRFSLLALCYGPFLLAVGVSLVWNPVLLFRGLFPTIPALLLLLSEASEKPRSRFWLAAAIPVLVISLYWYMYQGFQGRIKGDNANSVLTADVSGMMVHLNDATLLPYAVYRPDLNHVYLEKGCPADHGQLTEMTREALGFESITLEELPESYSLAALVGPLSTDCEERVYRELTEKGMVINRREILFSAGEVIGVNGVWSYGN